MVSAVGSTQASSSSSAVTSIAKIAALNKQASSLRQQLLRANKSGESDPDSNQTEALTREIVSVQTQIEQLILEAQLSRLNVANATKRSDDPNAAHGSDASGASGGKTTDAAAAPDAHKGANPGANPTRAGSPAHLDTLADAHGSRPSDPYKAPEDAGQLVDVKV